VFSGSTSSTPGGRRIELSGQYIIPSQRVSEWSTLGPSLFATIDSVEDIHSFVFRCLGEVAENRQGVDHLVASYFLDVHAWFPIVDGATFERQLEELWVTPSAETCLVILAMRLITRPSSPNPVAGMADRHYLSIKSILSLVQSKTPLSIPLLQAQLLVALYEFSHSMPQQAYMSVGNCVQMTRAFGWQTAEFWNRGRHCDPGPRAMKLCSILWWAIVYVDW